MPPPGAVAAAFARRLLWRLALSGLGGIDVRGKLPRGGCVVVANHTSHADTVALLAALGPRHAPTVGAAADYWFAKRTWRRWLCRSLAAGFPIRRPGGDLDNLLAKARSQSAVASAHAVQAPGDVDCTASDPAVAARRQVKPALEREAASATVGLDRARP